MEQVNVVEQASAPTEVPKVKKPRTDKQKEALAKGQAALKAYKEAKKKDKNAPKPTNPTPAASASPAVVDKPTSSAFSWSEEIEDRLVGKIMNRMSEALPKRKPRAAPKPKAPKPVEEKVETPSNTKPKEKPAEAPAAPVAPAVPTPKRSGNKMLDRINGIV